jgi:hypothetical protein
MEKNVFLWSIAEGDHRKIDELSERGKSPESKTPSFTFTMQINGVEVDAERVMERMEQACEYTAAVKSREALEAKFNELSEAFEPIKSILDTAEARLRADLGIEKDSWDY